MVIIVVDARRWNEYFARARFAASSKRWDSLLQSVGHFDFGLLPPKSGRKVRYELSASTLASFNSRHSAQSGCSYLVGYAARFLSEW